MKQIAKYMQVLTL